MVNDSSNTQVLLHFLLYKISLKIFGFQHMTANSVSECRLKLWELTFPPICLQGYVERAQWASIKCLLCFFKCHWLKSNGTLI